MNTTCRSLLLGLALLPVTASGADDAVLTTKWTVTEGIQAPESAHLDPASGILFLSQIGAGGGKTKDGDGWISKMTPEGGMTEHKWVTGLDSPKGLRSHDGVLWVSDIDQLVSISIASGKILSRITVPDATFLNDVAIGPDGTVYVSDMFQGRIIAVKDGKSAVFLEGPSIEHSNGLLVQGDRLILAGWGLGIADDNSTKTPGRVLAVDLKTKKITPLSKPIGNLDGIESDGGGGYVVSDWMAGKVFHVSAAGTTTTLATFPQGAADIGYIPARRLLLLPEMLENKVSAIEIRSAVLPKP